MLSFGELGNIFSPNLPQLVLNHSTFTHERSTMVFLENDAFLTELTKLFQKSRTSGTVYMTFKRHDGHEKPTPRAGRPPLPDPTENMCLIRAKCKTKKISTLVHQRDINRFQVAYSSLLKGNLDGLKKLKKPKTKTKAE